MSPSLSKIESEKLRGVSTTGEAPPRKLRLGVLLEGLQMQLLDDFALGVASAAPDGGAGRWLLSRFRAGLRVVEDRPAGGEVAEVSALVHLSRLDLLLTSSDVGFFIVLADELSTTFGSSPSAAPQQVFVAEVALLDPATSTTAATSATSATSAASAASTLGDSDTATDDDFCRSSSVGAPTSTSQASKGRTSFQASTGKTTIQVGLLLHWEEGLRLRISDDSEDTFLPVVEVRVTADAEGRLALPGMADPSAHVSVKMRASSFNPRCGAWEPMLEPWVVAATWALVAAGSANVTAGGAADSSSAESTSARGTDADEGQRAVTSGETESSTGGAGTQREGASGGRPTRDGAKGGGAAREACLVVSAKESMEVVVSFALLQSLVRFAKAATLEAHRLPSSGGRADHSDAHQQTTSSHALRNLTEAPLTFQLDGAPTQWLVAPGGTTVFSVSGNAHTSAEDDEGLEATAATTENEALVRAVMAGRTARVVLLLSRGVPIDSRLHGATALHAAVRLGREDLVQLLVEAMADVDVLAETKKGLSPLHLAAATASTAMARLLLKLGANPGIVSRDGRTPDQLARSRSRLRELLASAHRQAIAASEAAIGLGSSLALRQLVDAARRGDIVGAQALLRAGVSPDASDHASTALCSAIAGRHLDLVLLLLRSAADTNLAAAGNVTPLHVAARRGPTATVALLVTAAADPTLINGEGALACECTTRFTVERSRVQRALRAHLLSVASWTGWLTKLGGQRRSWQRRFCVLLPAELRYFSDASLTVARGHVSLRQRLYEQLRSPSFYPHTPTPFSFELGSGKAPSLHHGAMPSCPAARTS